MAELPLTSTAPLMSDSTKSKLFLFLLLLLLPPLPVLKDLMRVTAASPAPLLSPDTRSPVWRSTGLPCPYTMPSMLLRAPLISASTRSKWPFRVLLPMKKRSLFFSTEGSNTGSNR